MSDALPAGYERVRVGRTELVAKADIAASLTHALREAPSLYDWAAEQPQPRALRGRAPVYVATLASGETVAVRHAWHGGAFAPVTQDLWLRPSRAPHELRKSIALVNGGVPTAPILGYALYPAALGFVRVDVVSQFIEDTFDLGAVLMGLAAGVSIDQATAATRVLVRTINRQRLVHPDLNVKNILLQKCTQSASAPHRSLEVRALVIDVDTMRHRTDLSEAQVSAANLERLSRSLHKWKRQTESDFDVVEVLKAIITTSSGDHAPLQPIIGFGD
jgi:3-deoxy-D-manno-octulosonic acid kinase